MSGEKFKMKSVFSLKKCKPGSKNKNSLKRKLKAIILLTV